jgi:outer membrane protein OmpA-like peptidoglycan-associated protein
VRRSLGLAALLFFFSSPALADGPRVHLELGGATATSRELGSGGGGAARVELPLAGAVGVQAGAGAVVLARGEAPSDPSLAAKSSTSGIFGSAGVRVHPFGAGPWADANAGVSETGGLVRPSLDTHLGWDFSISRTTGFSMGPFVGYTQIVQPNDSLRPDDARILWAGVSISLGGGQRPHAAPEPRREAPPPPVPAIEDRDGLAEAFDACPDGEIALPDGMCGTSVELLEDRIVIGDILHFELNSPVILAPSRRVVERVAEIIVAHPEIEGLRIEGHTDARGTEAYNKVLSEARAASTRDLLVSFGVDRSRLVVAGFGKSRLKVRTPFAERENRRVEFIIVKRGAGPQAMHLGGSK